MIERYLEKEMKEIFNDKSKFNAFLDVELASSEAFQKLGVVPLNDLLLMQKNAKVDLDLVYKLEQETHHDVVAFTRALSASLGEEKKWVHYGLTSTDVVDTANAIIYQKANILIGEELNKLLKTFMNMSLKYQFTPCIGRTHGMHADITSFGLKWALYYDELKRDLNRFKLARNEIEVGKISGAVGNFANVDIFVQDYVCKKLNIGSSSISTQVLQRDRHAFYASVLAVISGLLEKVALEIRNLQRTEVGEVEEYFAPNQKGSSAMPHKRNPIGSENIVGSARIMRGYLSAILEDMALFHERDISHSIVERVALVDAICLVFYMIRRLNKIVSNLVVYPSKMIKNINITRGVIFSQRVLSLLIGKGLSRESAYDLIQKEAMKAIENDEDFKTLISSNKEVIKYLSSEEIDDCFTYDYYFKNIERIYSRVGLK